MFSTLFKMSKDRELFNAHTQPHHHTLAHTRAQCVIWEHHHHLFSFGTGNNEWDLPTTLFVCIHSHRVARLPPLHKIFILLFTWFWFACTQPIVHRFMFIQSLFFPASCSLASYALSSYRTNYKGWCSCHSIDELHSQNEVSHSALLEHTTHKFE